MMGSCQSIDNVEYKDTIPFIPPLKSGKVIKVYDGDTITVASKMPWDNSPYYRFSVRLNGIDCPEMRSKDENETTCAKKARDLLSEKILHKIVTLENVDTEKYGRVLADVMYNNEPVTKCLLDSNLAVEYHGGRKNCPENWLDYFNSRSTP
jgi:endonuclease YncB( thermonuclease family)